MNLIQDQFDADGVAAMNRALTFVVCAGILEQLMRDLPAALSSDLCALRVPRKRLPMGLLAILEAVEFRRCAEQNVASFSSRAKLLRSISLHSGDERLISDFSDDLKLADGKTVNERQFSALWELLDLPGEWRNDPKDLLLLKEIQAKRNSIAHWEQDPVAVGRMKTYVQLRETTRSLGLLLDHVQLHLCDWLDKMARLQLLSTP
ncbi:hypothetical protein O7626_41390 [Micromonospora sp. WMMD1102]|uniref:hypothetical protein n=1 Tax=Micromonospora sp. WMMD1102 TaxID=3016105 RepID=UPI002415954E|nr:hypothetical protein [Micromonospora sp. WMMD1102]MDG4791047.1 hypothetical protein [Micromonospora sp. WMMD1102]MDG4792261.1 hypothetical protein [Micromonospora sp. WMMD1102]